MEGSGIIFNKDWADLRRWEGREGGRREKGGRKEGREEGWTEFYSDSG